MEFNKKVLDCGYVKYINHMGTEETIVEAARMSTNKGFQGWDKDAKFLEFLYRNHHSTPFEMCELAIEISAPIFVIREWHRHRTQSFNEMSGRYTQMPNEHYVPEHGRIALQSTENKQGSGAAMPQEVADAFLKHIKNEQDEIYAKYEADVQAGIAKEVARINTPVSRYSRFRAKANLRNWLHFLKLRKASNAQWEIRQYADAVGEIIEQLWPQTYKLFLEWDLEAKTFSKSEMKEIAFLVSMLESNFGQISQEGLESRLGKSVARDFLLKIRGF